MRGHSVRCYATDLSSHRKAIREQEKLNVGATTIYKEGLAFHVPREQHYANGKVRTAVYNLIKDNTVIAMVKLHDRGITITKENLPEGLF